MLVVQEFVSVDGFAADANGEFSFAGVIADWSDLDADQLQLLDGVGTILLGRKTYELFIEYWPTADHVMAKPINTTPKTVISQSLESAPWGDWPAATVRNGPLPDVIRDSANDVLVWGSLDLTKSLLRQGLVDELRLIVCPLILGAGVSVTPPEVNTPLKLADSKTYSNGAVTLTYRT
jgi:dihydrofolate reductase